MRRPFGPSKGLAGPDHYWALMRQAGEDGFTVRDIAGCSNGPSFHTVKCYIKRCRDLGAVAVIGDASARKGKRATLYRVAIATTTAPVERRAAYTGRRGLVQQALWDELREGESLRLDVLAVSASTDEVEVSYSAAREYVRLLVKAGYVVVEAPMVRSIRGARPGARGGLYRLPPKSNTGPKPPKVLKGRIYDPNLDRIVSGVITPVRDRLARQVSA